MAVPKVIESVESESSGDVFLTGVEAIGKKTVRPRNGDIKGKFKKAKARTIFLSEKTDARRLYSKLEYADAK